jgi:ribonuclease VapC
VTVILDSSALLALLWQEPGAAKVAPLLGDASISTVNMAEVVTKMVDRGFDDATASDIFLSLGLSMVPFDSATSLLAGQLRRETKSLGLSLGDRACIALGVISGHKILTADKVWAKVSAKTEIEIIR